MSAANPKTGREMLVIGLSEGNLGELRKERPIVIHGEEWGQAFDLMIFWGPTEQAMVAMVKPYIGPETRVIDNIANPPKKN
jgi:hypothetical protein